MLFLYLILQLAFIAYCQNGTGNSSELGAGSGGDVPYKRNIIFVGGQYSTNATGSFLSDRLYVEELLPVSGVKAADPVVFFPGGFDAGTQWLTKPDGNAGWASWFLSKGHAVYIVDPYSVGRSSYNPAPAFVMPQSTEACEAGFTSPEKSPLAKYYQKKFHTQWPGTGQKGDPIFDKFYASLLPGTYGADALTAMQKGSCELLAQLKSPAILVSHSIGASPAFLATDKCPDRVKAHVSVEGDTSPFASNNAGVGGLPDPFRSRAYGLSDIPLNYDPPISNPAELNPVKVGSNEQTDGLLSKYYCYSQGAGAALGSGGNATTNSTQVGGTALHKLPNIAKAPVLQLTGEGSVHAIYDQCLVDYLKLTGVTVTWAVLADEGIKGNGHFMMLEKNSDQIAEYVYKWIRGLSKRSLT